MIPDPAQRPEAQVYAARLERLREIAEELDVLHRELYGYECENTVFTPGEIDCLSSAAANLFYAKGELLRVTG